MNILLSSPPNTPSTPFPFNQKSGLHIWTILIQYTFFTPKIALLSKKNAIFAHRNEKQRRHRNYKSNIFN